MCESEEILSMPEGLSFSPKLINYLIIIVIRRERNSAEKYIYICNVIINMLYVLMTKG